MVVGSCWLSMKTAVLSNSCWPAVETAMVTGKCWRGVGAAVVVVQGINHQRMPQFQRSFQTRQSKESALQRSIDRFHRLGEECWRRRAQQMEHTGFNTIAQKQLDTLRAVQNGLALRNLTHYEQPSGMTGRNKTSGS